MNKQKIVPLTAIAFVILGGAAVGVSKMNTNVVHAQTIAPVNQVPVVQQPTESTVAEVADGNEQEPNYTSSIRIQESGREMDDAAEAKNLVSLAKISSDQAKATAEKQAGGKATSIKLEEENGSVVYAVTVGSKEVKIDAGNGKVLATETAEAGDSKEADNEAN